MRAVTRGLRASAVRYLDEKHLPLVKRLPGGSSDW
jgi:hypothetical protein